MLALNNAGIKSKTISRGTEICTPVSRARIKPKTAGAMAERNIAPGVDISINMERVSFPDAACCFSFILTLSELYSSTTLWVFPALNNLATTYNTACSAFQASFVVELQ